MAKILKFGQINENLSHDVRIELSSDDLGDDFYKFSGKLSIDVKIEFDTFIPYTKYSGKVIADHFEFNFESTDDGNIKIMSNTRPPKRSIIYKIVDEISKIINSKVDQNG